jgi:acetyl-CoA carboxylase carboxyltransferase component
MIVPMAADASVNAVYANKIAAIGSAAEREAFIQDRIEEQNADISLLRMASELVVDTVVEPAMLRVELARRLADAAGWSRAPCQRHRINSPV